MTLIDIETTGESNPVDLIEQIASSQGWSFERADDEEITITIGGSWCDYHVSLSWMSDLEALHLACAFDFRVTEKRQPEVVRLLAAVNEQLWTGHFDLWQSEGLVMYRNGILLNDADVTAAQIEGLLSAAVEACERYFQAFQFVVWAGRNAEGALADVLFETAGEA